MAIDTRDKRASVLDFLMPWDNIMPLANSTIDQEDRQQVSHMYRGILASVVAALLSESLPSLWMEYLEGQGFTQVGINSRLYAAFVSKSGVSGEVGLADAIHAYYDLQSVPTGTLNDRTFDFLNTNYPSLTGSKDDRLVQTLKNNAFFL